MIKRNDEPSRSSILYCKDDEGSRLLTNHRRNKSDSIITASQRTVSATSTNSSFFWLEDVPQSKLFKFSTRNNSDYKWKTEDTIVGALEVKSEPVLNIRKELRKHYVFGKEEEFQEFLNVWDELKLRKSFVEACENVPPQTTCLGLLPDAEATKRDLVYMLNRYWAKSINEKLEPKGCKLDCYLWTWRNPSGKARSNILLIRIHKLSDDHNNKLEDEQENEDIQNQEHQKQ